jgi:superfamily II DNA or RNA helicase
MIEDRQYQDDDVNHAMNHGVNDKIIHCAPTGSGKTIIQVKIAKRELDRGDATAILTPRNEIFDQTLAHARDHCGSSNVSVLRARREGEYWQPSRPVHIVSWPTLIARVRRDKDFWFPKVQRVLVDECHLSVAPKILELLEHYAPKARIDGYTATPARLTGRGLGFFFTEIKHVTTVRQLIADGYLAPIEYYGASTPDLTGIKIRRGDYETKKLSKACIELVGDAVDNFLRLAPDRHTIVFAVDIAHCEALADRYRRVGIKAAALHTGMDTPERDAVVSSFKAGSIQVLCNVSIASYGFDAPSVNCIQICRPTKSIVLHLQMMGRGMRPAMGEDGLPIKDRDHPDFKTCLVLDHAGNVQGLGMADDLYRWRLDEGSAACHNWTRDERSGESDEAKPHTCDNCQHIFSQSRICPKCGWKVPFAKRDVDTTEADLVPIGRNQAHALPDGWPSYEVFFGMLRHYYHEKKKSKYAAIMTFKDKAKCSPPEDWNNHAMVPPSQRVLNWIIHRNIKYAAQQRKRRAQGSS